MVSYVNAGADYNPYANIAQPQTINERFNHLIFDKLETQFQTPEERRDPELIKTYIATLVASGVDLSSTSLHDEINWFMFENGTDLNYGAPSDYPTLSPRMSLVLNELEAELFQADEKVDKENVRLLFDMLGQDDEARLIANMNTEIHNRINWILAE